jgi:hypothetical protein
MQALFGPAVAIFGVLAIANPTSGVSQVFGEPVPQVAASLPTLLIAYSTTSIRPSSRIVLLMFAALTTLLGPDGVGLW